MARSVTAAASVFDIMLAVALIAAAWFALSTEDLLMAIALLVAFGLLMTLAWARLAAPDVALAEAGIGTGFSGALFLAALARLERKKRGEGNGNGNGDGNGNGNGDGDGDGDGDGNGNGDGDGGA